MRTIAVGAVAVASVALVAVQTPVEKLIEQQAFTLSEKYVPAAPALRPVATNPRPKDARTRAFSPQQPLKAPATATASLPITATVNAANGPLMRPGTNVVASTSDIASRWATNTIPSTDTHTPYQLIRDIQRELRRQGCYAGEIDGDWGPGSKRAMKTFTERVNALLPVEQPDHILLTLLQSVSGSACASSCPPGRSIADGGRCLPTSLVAQARRRPETTRQAVASATDRTRAWTSEVVAAPQTTGPRIALTTSETTPVSSTAAAPLPGRMTLGAAVQPAPISDLRSAVPLDAPYRAQQALDGLEAAGSTKTSRVQSAALETSAAEAAEEAPPSAVPPASREPRRGRARPQVERAPAPPPRAQYRPSRNWARAVFFDITRLH